MAQYELNQLRSRGVQRTQKHTTRLMTILIKHIYDRRHTQLPYLTLDKKRKEIRVLRVKAGKRRQAVHCELEQAFLGADELPKYETISYCWGNSNAKGSLILNGRRTEVTASSEAALRCMRFQDKDRILWIDAICINQRDKDERASQVGFMHEIYSNGQRNLIYLGKSNKSIQHGAGILQLVLDNARRETNNYESWANVTMGESGEYRLSDTGIELPQDLRQLFDFFSAPWFGRLWVAQEAALSRSNTCYHGRCQVPLEDVLRAARWLEHKSRFLSFYLRDQPGMQNASSMFEFCSAGLEARRISNARSFTLVEILDYVRDLESSEPKDRIYAILGLHHMLTGSSALADAVELDYHQNLRTIVRDAAKFAIQERDDLFILNYIEMFPSDKSVGESWPSWIPHWHIKEVDEDMPKGLAEVFNAGDGHTLDFESVISRSDPDVLVLTGFQVDIASTLFPARQFEFFWDGHELSHMIQNIQGCLDAKHIEASNLGATLIVGTTHSSERAADEFCNNFSGFLTYTKETGQTPELSQAGRNDEHDQHSDLASLWAYHQALYNALDNRCFFITASGYIGVGPRTMHSQDIIAVLYGSKWPVVLHPVENGQFRVLGTCYVHGIMDGEAVRRFKAEKREQDVFIVQ